MDNNLDLIGKKFGNWSVLKQGEDKLYSNGKDRPIKKMTAWVCMCECGNCDNIIRTVVEQSLTRGISKGCGTSAHLNNLYNKKYNKYNLILDYGIGYTSKNEEFYFDLNDYDKIKNYCWSYQRAYNKDYISSNYLIAYSHTENNIKKNIFLHNLVMDNLDRALTIDHINGDTIDNKKCNLRKIKAVDNYKNKKNILIIKADIKEYIIVKIIPNGGVIYQLKTKE